MPIYLSLPEQYDDSDYEEPDYKTCKHGQYMHPSNGLCEECEDEFEQLAESKGGYDKCLCCGRIRWGIQLNNDQVCIISCRNPNEY